MHASPSPHVQLFLAEQSLLLVQTWMQSGPSGAKISIEMYYRPKLQFYSDTKVLIITIIFDIDPTVSGIFFSILLPVETLGLFGCSALSWAVSWASLKNNFSKLI